MPTTKPVLRRINLLQAQVLKFWVAKELGLVGLFLTLKTVSQAFYNKMLLGSFREDRFVVLGAAAGIPEEKMRQALKDGKVACMKKRNNHCFLLSQNRCGQQSKEKLQALSELSIPNCKTIKFI